MTVVITGEGVTDYGWKDLEAMFGMKVLRQSY